MDRDGSKKTRLTFDPQRDDDPAWSPDGEEIAFGSWRMQQEDVWVMQADGSNPRNLTLIHGGGSLPTWAPNGSKIAFSGFEDDEWRTYTMDPDGSNRQSLGPGSDGFSPSYSPDGGAIAVHYFRQGPQALPQTIFIFDGDGSNRRQLMDDARGAYTPDWRPYR